MRRCFVCKVFQEVKPIGLQSIGCREIYLCDTCNLELKNIKINGDSQKGLNYTERKGTKNVKK